MEIISGREYGLLKKQTINQQIKAQEILMTVTENIQGTEEK